MCGITGGVWTRPERALNAPTLQRMVAALRHRGPDDEGFFLAGPATEGAAAMLPRPPVPATAAPGARAGAAPAIGVALGHRRLAIIDVSGGRQPLANEDGSIWIVFNGEIYNYRSLRRRLEGTGHRFHTHSDTEVIVHLYEDHGLGFVEHLNGMFALALWDARQRQLVLARDRLGEKPLVYRVEPGRLLFASELKSLLEIPGVPRAMDPQALDAYLTYQYVPHPLSIFRGFAKLPPGHLAVYRDERLEVRPYWQPDFQREESRSLAEYAAELRELLTSAVQLRLESEVPLGAFLSGGTDSTIVVGLMQRLCSEPVRTFSIGFPVPEYDETRYARLAAERFKTDHCEFRVEPDAVQILPRLVWHYDEPFADSSAIPTWYVAELTRQHVTVALTGDGGDELFAGYPRYRAVWLGEKVDRLPRMVRRALSSRWWQRLPGAKRQKSVVRRLRRFSEALAQPPLRRYLEWIAIFRESQRAALYSEDFLGVLPDADPLEFLASAAARSSQRDPVSSICLTDLLTYLPGDLMTKVDIAAMAHGLETRPPLLDHRVVELAARMPLRHKFRWGQGKGVLRQAFADLLPGPIRRRSKMGFGVPLDHWFRGPLADLARQVLLDRRTLGRGLFRPEAVTALVESHVAGRADHSYRLWALLVLEMWQREWLD